MKRLAAGVLAFAASFAAAAAAGYDDFTQGMTANLRGDYGVAVSAFTAALAAPDLVPAYKPVALLGRAEAYLEKDMCPEALTDLNAFLALKPTNKRAIVKRVWAELCLKDAAAAKRDFDTLGDLNARDYWNFSRVEWRYGLYEDASAAAWKAYTKLDQKKPGWATWFLIWHALNAHRAGKLDKSVVSAAVKEMQLENWPLPIVELFIGKQSPESFRKRAAGWLGSSQQLCQADFYTAEWYLGNNDSSAATPLLLAATKECPEDFVEHSSSLAEMKRLGIPVPKE